MRLKNVNDQHSQMITTSIPLAILSIQRGDDTLSVVFIFTSPEIILKEHLDEISLMIHWMQNMINLIVY